ncbi:MAG: hypothetical protein A2176_04795 [Spirochaetes bacterium RBG_13_51_14]|nr:MAG: hypothetical protein A2176_04795 [Spirochaetes bacterium RBG_13_51_14]
MDVDQYYKILNINHAATDQEIAAAYKKLAFKYHPDKNPTRAAWATEAMTKLNLAYAAIMSYRFKDESTAATVDVRQKKAKQKKGESTHSTVNAIDPEILTKKFINLRESVKDALYRYFQYSLYSLPNREKVANQAIFNKTVFTLRRVYHAILNMKNQTDDQELLEHFSVFSSMLFSFYRASECLNIIDSYANQYDVEAYRVYREGDEQLHQAHREIFYDRHNRGYFKKDTAISLIIQAEKILRANLQIFPDSTWAVETGIKLEYAQSLREYLELFFTEDSP